MYYNLYNNVIIVLLVWVVKNCYKIVINYFCRGY